MNKGVLYTKGIIMIIWAVCVISSCEYKDKNEEHNFTQDIPLKNTGYFYTTEEATTEDVEVITYNKAEEPEPITEESKFAKNQKYNGKNKKSNEDASPIPKKTKPIDSTYFDDVVFVGDSVSQGFRDYIEWNKKELKIDYFGNAQFLTALNFGIRNALLGRKLPLYKGNQIPIEDAISQMNVRKVYILLGMNDIASFEINKIIEYYEEFIENILSKSPGLKIVIQSVTPLTRTENKDQTQKNFRQKRVDKLNNKLLKLAKEKGYYYMDIAGAVKDEEGFLPNEYSYKETCHMRPEALDIWINYLRTHAIQ